MDINQEKEHIYRLMRSITEERRELTSMYFSLKERLDSLIELEQKGLNNLDIRGYIDLFNKMKEFESKTMVSNIKREADNAIQNIRQEADYTVKKVEKEREEVRNSIGIDKEANNETQERLQQEIKAEEKKRVASKKIKKNTLSFEHVRSTVISTLKEINEAMSLKDLFAEVNDRLGGDLQEKNFSNNYMYRISKDEKSNIIRVGRGFYKYETKEI